MKKNKKIALAALFAFVICVGSINTNKVAGKTEPYVLLTENVEALSSGEGGESHDCWDKITTKPASYVVYCADCKMHDGTYTYDASLKTCQE